MQRRPARGRDCSDAKTGGDSLPLDGVVVSTLTTLVRYGGQHLAQAGRSALAANDPQLRDPAICLDDVDSDCVTLPDRPNLPGLDWGK
jgi:hypothetical protein